jgi:predicted DCC family thiol-disulfide oxidoreductase YuxK
MTKPITVYYDGKCSLCSKEITYYQRIAPPGVFDWQDITKINNCQQTLGISLRQGLEILHAKDSDGKYHVGVDAFMLIWRQLPYWRSLATVIALPLINPLANAGYRVFARWRFKRLKYCQITE